MKPARQTSSIWCVCKLVLQRALERLAILAERLVIDDGGARCRRLRARCKPGGVGLVGNDQRDLGRIAGVLRGLDQRRHVGAAAGDQDGDALAGHAAHQTEVELAGVASRAACLSRAATTSPSCTTRLALALEHRGDRVGLARLDHRDHADAAVEGAQHLGLGDAAGLRPATGTPAAPGCARDRCARRVLRQHARDVVGKAAAGDVGQRLDAPWSRGSRRGSDFT